MADGRENLIPMNKRTEAEQREIAKKGGEKSGEARRKKKLFNQLINDELLKTVKVTGVDGVQELTAKEVITMRLVRMLADEKTKPKDFIKALEFARDTIGEKPVDKLEYLNDITIDFGNLEDKE